MTLLVGIKSTDGVVLASDSQVTTGTGKRTDSTKMENVEFSNFPVLVAQAGSVLLTNRFVDIFRQLADKVAAKTPDEVGRVAQTAMRMLRTELRELHFDCSSEELSGILLKSGDQAAVMMGFFMDEKPHLITINLDYATYQKSRFDFETEGCGAPLGQYILTEYSSPTMDVYAATMAAIYTVEMVKKHDAYCGGPTRVGVLKDFEGMPSIVSYDSSKIAACAAYLAKADLSAKPERLKVFQDKINGPKLREIGLVYMGSSPENEGEEIP